MPSINKLLSNTNFFTSAAKFSSLPDDFGAEIAFAGRSNAGKSSVLNKITGRKNLAKTSSTPGKTRLINLFALDQGRNYRFADLPGYGYAKVNYKELEKWGHELTLYITERESLKGVIIVMDIRHPLTENDRQMLTLCRTGDKKVHVLLNKSDKLKSGKKSQTLSKVKKELALISPGASCQVFSAQKGEGFKELKALLSEWYLLA